MFIRFLLCSFALVLFPALSFGAAESLYVRPVGSCPFNGNGTAYGCSTTAQGSGAFIGTNFVLWSASDETVGKVDPGDTLYICGHHLITSASYRVSPTVSGTSGQPITLSGACPNDPGLLDGTNTSVRLINLGSAGPINYITVDSLTLQNVPTSSDYALSGYDNGALGFVDRHITISNNTLQHIGGIGMWLWGGAFTVTGNTLHDIGDDAIYIKGGKDTTLSYNTVDLVSQTGIAGDCYQFDSATTQAIVGTGTVHIHHNVCDKSMSPNVKYGILVGPTTGPTIIEYNRVLCPTAATLSSGCNPIYVNAGGTARSAEITVRGNFVSKGWRGITIATANNTGFRHQLSGNVMIGAGTFGAWIDANSDNVDIRNNTFRDNQQYGLYLGKVMTSHLVMNNIFAGNAVGLFYLNIPSGGSTYNDWYGQTDANIRDSKGVKARDPSDLISDPQFRSSSDSRLQGTSLLLGAGAAWPGCMDLRENVCHTPPDLGAYQIQPGDAGVSGKNSPQ